MSSGKTTCKEVCTKSKCIVKEKMLKKKDNKEDYKKKECKATIVGVITLPESMCCNNKEDEYEKKEDCEKKDDCLENDFCEQKNDIEDMKDDECKEVFRDLGECLQKCIVKVSKDDEKEDYKRKDRCC